MYTCRCYEKFVLNHPLIPVVPAEESLDHMVSCGPRMGNYTRAGRSVASPFRGH